jgi:spermidine/putrescine transport system ATP-binding protein
VHVGAQVWLSWNIDHGFGLDDDPAEAPRYEADLDTKTIARQRRSSLITELEGA